MQASSVAKLLSKEKLYENCRIIDSDLVVIYLKTANTAMGEGEQASC